MTTTTPKTKTWTTVGTFSNFSEADQERNNIINLYDSVKVKRSGKNGDLFRVRVWNPPIKKVEVKEKSKKNFKKGKNDRRHQKNVNKKVRTWSKR